MKYHVCPSCGGKVGSRERFCGNCGSPIRICSTCGAANLTHSPFCHLCGTRILIERTAAKRPVAAGIIAVVIIIILAVGAIAIVSMPKPSPSPYYATETPQRTPEPYVKLRVEAGETQHHWARDSATDLPCCESTISYTVSNDGTAYADNVEVIVVLDGGMVRSIIISISPQGYQSDNIQFAFGYDTSHTVLIKASSSTSEDEITLSIDAMLPRYFSEEVASLYITPNDIAVRNTLNEILTEYSLLPFKWIAIRDWVSNNIEYSYESREYWQLPRETLLSRTGDCEDYAILLVSLYRAVGYDADRVFVVGGKNENGEGHGWVRIQIDMIGWQNIEPQAPALLTFVGDYLILSGFTAYVYFNDAYTYYTKP